MPYDQNITVTAGGPQGPQPGHFSEVAGGSVGQGYVSALDYYEPFELVEIYARHQMKPTFLDWIGVYGNESYAANPKVGHYERGERKAYLRFSAVAVPAGGEVVATYDTSIMRDDSLEVGGAARQSSPGRVGEEIYVTGNVLVRIMSKDTSGAQHTVTLRPVDSTTNLATAVLADTNYAIVGNSHGEGTGGMKGAIPQLVRYQNDFQIIKEAVGVTGSSLTNRLRFNPVLNQPGSFFMLAEWETLYRFDEAKSNVLLMGQRGDGNITVTSDQTGYDVTVNHTQGMEDFYRTGGFNNTYTDGSLTFNDLRDNSRYLEVNKIGANEVLSWLGYDLYDELEQAAETFLDANADVYVMNQLIASRLDYTAADESPMDAQSLALNLSFRSVKAGGFRYSWYLLHEFNDSAGFGMSTYNFTDVGIFVPNTNTMNYLTNSPDPLISVVYKELNGYRRKNVIATLAGAGVGGEGGYTPLAVHDIDGMTIHMVSELAFHGTTANRGIYMSPA